MTGSPILRNNCIARKNYIKTIQPAKFSASSGSTARSFLFVVQYTVPMPHITASETNCGLARDPIRLFHVGKPFRSTVPIRYTGVCPVWTNYPFYIQIPIFVSNFLLITSKSEFGQLKYRFYIHNVTRLKLTLNLLFILPLF